MSSERRGGRPPQDRRRKKSREAAPPISIRDQRRSPSLRRAVFALTVSIAAIGGGVFFERSRTSVKESGKENVVAKSEGKLTGVQYTFSGLDVTTDTVAALEKDLDKKILSIVPQFTAQGVDPKEVEILVNLEKPLDSITPVKEKISPEIKTSVVEALTDMELFFSITGLPRASFDLNEPQTTEDAFKDLPALKNGDTVPVGVIENSKTIYQFKGDIMWHGQKISALNGGLEMKEAGGDVVLHLKTTAGADGVIRTIEATHRSAVVRLAKVREDYNNESLGLLSVSTIEGLHQLAIQNMVDQTRDAAEVRGVKDVAAVAVITAETQALHEAAVHAAHYIWFVDYAHKAGFDIPDEVKARLRTVHPGTSEIIKAFPQNVESARAIMTAYQKEPEKLMTLLPKK